MFTAIRATLILAFLSPLLSCKTRLADEITAGDVHLCAGIVGQPEPDTGFAWDVEGEVVEDVPGDGLSADEPCAGAERVLKIAADDGQTYHLGYGLSDAEDAPIAAELAVEAGDRVRMELLATIGYFYTGHGLALHRGETLLAAIADNKAPPLDALRVVEGDQLAAEETECGDQRGWEMVFEADERLALAPVASGALTVAGAPMQAWALAGWDWEPQSGDLCTDLLSFWEWAVFASP